MRLKVYREYFTTNNITKKKIKIKFYLNKKDQMSISTNFDPIPQDIAIAKLQNIKLNDECTSKKYKIKRAVFPGNTANGNVEIAYLEAGDCKSKPFILIPGFPLTKECFIPTIRLIVREGYHVFAIDQRGFGSSGKPDPTVASNYELTKNAIDLHELITYLGIQNPIIQTHSYANQVLFEYLKLYNSGIYAPSKIISQNGYTQFQNSGSFVFTNSPSTVSSLATILFTQGYPTFLNLIVNLSVNDICETKCCQKELTQVKKFAFLMGSTTTGDIAGAIIGGILASVTTITDLGAIKEPTFVVTGSLDQVINPRAPFYIATYLGITLDSTGNLDPTIQQGTPNVQITEFRGAGHFLHMTHTVKLVKQVLKFLDNVNTPCSLVVNKKEKVKLLECDC